MRKTKENISKIGLIFVILIFSLASISVSYAGWTDTIHVSGSVTTSEDDEYIIYGGGSDETCWARMNDDPNNFCFEFPGNNWATYLKCTPTEDMQTFYLYAGQHIRVGELNIWRNTNFLYVEFYLSEDYFMDETHLHVSSCFDDIPTTPSGNPKLGLFGHCNEFDPFEQQIILEVDWDDSWTEQELFIAFHGVVWGFF